MTRRQWVALAALALPLGNRAIAAESTRGSRKKGLCLSGKNRTPEELSGLLRSVGARWLYNWNTIPPKKLAAGVEFVPMIYSGRWGVDESIARVQSQIKTHGYRELLGYNEPDVKKQGNTLVEKALNAWPKLEATGLRLGSPSCVHPDNEWMTTFMKGVEKRGLRVDFVCMHTYGGPDVDALIAQIKKVHALYRRPVWLTEFAVGDWKAKAPEENRHRPEAIAEFVTQLLPQLDAMDIVERYSWFHGGIRSNALGTSALFQPDGSLTVVGKAYRGSSGS